MLAEVIQLEEISWRLWREEGNCHAFIRPQSRTAQFLWLLIHCRSEGHAFLKTCHMFSRKLVNNSPCLGCILALEHYSTNP